MTDISGPPSTVRRTFVGLLALLIGFTVCFKGAHDLWAATLVYVTLLGLMVALLLVPTHVLGAAPRAPAFVPATLVLLALVFSFRQSVNPSESFLALMDWTAFFGVFFLAAHLFQNDGDIALFFAFLAPFFFLEYAVMFHQWLKIHYFMKHTGLVYEEPVGTFVNGNSAVAFCLLWFPWLISRAVSATKRTRWYWATAATSVLIVFLLVSSAFSAICLITGALAWFAGPKLRRLYVSHPAVLSAGLALSVIGVLALVWYKLALIYGWHGIQPDRQTTSRLDWWVAGLKMLKDHPWFGVGIGNYPSAYLAYKTGVGQNTLYAHSAVIQLLAETGAMGFTAVVFFFWTVFGQVKSAVTTTGKALGIGLLMFGLYSLLQVSLEYLSHLLALGVALGMLMGRVRNAEGFNMRPAWKVLAVGLAVCAVPYLVSPFLASRFWVDGNHALSRNDWDGAEKQFRSAIELDTRPWEPYAGLAHVALARGDRAAAAAFTREALARNRCHPRLIRRAEAFGR